MSEDEFKTFFCRLLEECFGQTDSEIILERILEQLVLHCEEIGTEMVIKPPPKNLQ